MLIQFFFYNFVLTFWNAIKLMVSFKFYLTYNWWFIHWFLTIFAWLYTVNKAPNNRIKTHIHTYLLIHLHTYINIYWLFPMTKFHYFFFNKDIISLTKQFYRISDMKGFFCRIYKHGFVWYCNLYWLNKLFLIIIHNYSKQ